MSHSAITRATHSRGAVTISVVIAAVCATLAWLYGRPTSVVSYGLVGAFDATAMLTPIGGFVAEVVLTVCVGAMIHYLIKHYNLFRKMTHLHTALFVLLQSATPVLLVVLCPGTLLCLVVMYCIGMLYTCYGDNPPDTRRPFTVFLLLSACSAIDITYIIYMPVMLIGCMQMRIMHLRTISAMVLGIITPWIILMGFGIVSPSDITFPDVDVRMPFVNAMSDNSAVATVLVTLILTGALLLVNMFKANTYNAQFRALHGLLSVTTMVTMVMALVFIATPESVLTMLNACAAIQIAHWYVASLHTHRAYIFLIVLTIIYLLLFVWNLTN